VTGLQAYGENIYHTRAVSRSQLVKSCDYLAMCLTSYGFRLYPRIVYAAIRPNAAVYLTCRAIWRSSANTLAHGLGAHRSSRSSLTHSSRMQLVEARACLHGRRDGGRGVTRRDGAASARREHPSHEGCIAVPAWEILGLSRCVALPVDLTAPQAPLQLEWQGTHTHRHPRPGAEGYPSVLARLSGEENSPG